MRAVLCLLVSMCVCHGAIQFDNASSERVDFGDIAALDGVAQLSVMCWAKPMAIVAFESIVNKSDSAPVNGWSLQRWSSETNLGVFVANASTIGFGVTTDHSYTSNVWHHLAMVYDGSLTGDANRLKLFVDGNQKTLNFILTPVPATTGPSTNNLTFAACCGPSYLNHGTVIIDDVVIVTRVLSTAEMERHRLGKIRLTVFDNQVYTPLDNIPLGQSCNSAIILDRSNNNRMGVGKGGISVQSVGFSYP